MLHRLVQQRAQTFFAQTEEATGASLAQFTNDEFDAFLECGILAPGFLRLRCAALIAVTIRSLPLTANAEGSAPRAGLAIDYTHLATVPSVVLNHPPRQPMEAPQETPS